MAKSNQVTPAMAVDEDGHELRMGFFDHLGELRNRIFKAILALVVGTVIGFVFAEQGLELLRTPFCNLFDNATTLETCEFQVLDPANGIIIWFRVALLIGGILAIPMMTYQVMMFIMPGLTNKERRNVLLALPGITILFLVGVFFAWYVLIPPALTFLNGFMPDFFRPEWTADGYLSFVTSLIFWMGVAFETPLVFFVLSLMGLVTARWLIKNWRLAIVGSSIAAAFITPTIDPVNMFLVMGPLLGLYLLSILLVFIGNRINGIGK
ncbi:MAG: twin-arginine translocase subunit TatC [Anaerolineae bacterium]|nr:twin-arginine translocase subunit TatC [Anaerolineae bacterium]